uniref:Uncharacterized protein n=1 Tax=Plectus sambesii TaxID=2011161 RepID=A0A914XBA8_9BILA
MEAKLHRPLPPLLIMRRLQHQCQLQPTKKLQPPLKLLQLQLTRLKLLQKLRQHQPPTRPPQLPQPVNTKKEKKLLLLLMRLPQPQLTRPLQLLKPPQPQLMRPLQPLKLPQPQLTRPPQPQQQPPQSKPAVMLV